MSGDEKRPDEGAERDEAATPEEAAVTEGTPSAQKHVEAAPSPGTTAPGRAVQPGPWARVVQAARHRPTLTLLGGGALLLLVLSLIAAPLRLPAGVVSGMAGFTAVMMMVVGLRRLRLDPPTIGLIVAGMGFYAVYLGYTEYGERNYDGSAQLEYIEHIVTKRQLPPAAKCLICHHPPLYYVLGAGVYSFFKATRVAPPVVGLQLFSLLITLGLAVYGVLTARRLLTAPRLVWLATALLMFWPYSVHNSVRVHNDTLVSMLLVAALYHAVCWYQEDRARDLYLSAAMCALGVLTKSSAYPLIGLLLVLMGLRLFRAGGRVLLLKRGAVVIALLAASLMLNTLRKGQGESGGERGLCHRVLGSACSVSPASLMGNKPYNYLYFDVEGFLHQPYVLTDRDDSGRQLFWSHLLKSSLFGTHNKIPDRETAYELNRDVAGVMAALLLAMMTFGFVASASAPREGWRRFGVLILSLVSLVGFLAAFRILLPAPHHTDFRHIFPAVVPASILYAAAVGHARRKGRAIAPLGEGLCVAFLALSVLYWTPKWGLVLKWSHRLVPMQLASVERLVPEGSAWDRDGNVLFEGNHTLQFKLGKKDVHEIDLTVDSNDRYEISLEGTEGARTVFVGPSQRGPGMVRYIETLDPPAVGVRELRLRAVKGDRAYSLGHLHLR
ncbi:ArnT family glycosyltransferase [Chondromyces crocatus]|uniref:Glycosyltransferase RgtA/B/C/D-like domain-containing protein n=1 Tax=Chondromyces crocatus TaxID=52 RepID=A0A0K1EDZ5_CHOCO|nr:glycosyltransferase family 39 protein [Chondromyces crocatus]AKT38922.1 uncharacterized protein CMC5_030690 [Chondromyces crocatus]